MNPKFLIAVAGLMALLTPCVALAADGATNHAHNVFFSLKDKSPAAQEKLVAACHKYLKKHQGVLYFAAGRRAVAMSRDVNDQDFEVSLHITFRTKADHDLYQTHPEHTKFIEENSANWAKVRVFDSNVK